MKRNYIDRLKEYDARTSLKHKQKLYSSKFIKTCYNAHNKQNQDPNVRRHISLKSQRKSQRDAQDTKSTEKRDCQARGREVSQFKEAASPSQQAKKALLTTLRLQCVHWQRCLSSLQAQEVQKCKLYYQSIQDQLNKQQQSNISLIQGIYSRNKRVLQAKMAKLSEQLDCLELSWLDIGSSPMLEDTTVELQMAAVVLDAEMLRQALAEIAKFDLMHLGFLQKSQQQPDRLPASHSQRQAVPAIDQSLSCPQQLIDNRDTRRIVNQLDISFQNCQEFQPFGASGCPDPGQGCQISPSFKHF